MQKFTHTLQDPLGLHARPAANIVKEASKFAATLTISGNGKSADLKRLISLMTLGLKQDMEITVTATGSDEEAAISALQELCAKIL